MDYKRLSGELQKWVCGQDKERFHIVLSCCIQLEIPIHDLESSADFTELRISDNHKVHADGMVFTPLFDSDNLVQK